MNEVGVLGRFVKEFGKIVCMTQFNMYHHYTVDEHLVRSVGMLNQIENGDKEEELPILTDLFNKIRYRRALYVALLLHDVAKGQEEDHSILGARIANELCPRFGLSKVETEIVSWLIENHLVMSQMAQSRDLSDPNTIKDFANIVQSRERLMLLTILTVCDIRAVGPGVWNGWKRQLIRSLYLSTLPLLAGGYSDENLKSRVLYAKEKLKEKLTELSLSNIDNVIERHDDSYWIKTDLSQQVVHAKLLQDWDKGVHEFISSASFHDEGVATELTLVTKGVPRLLSKICWGMRELRCKYCWSPNINNY